MITITKQPNKTVENVFNNQVYEFTGDDQKTAVRANWEVLRGTDNLASGVVTANQNSFYLNLKRAVSLLMNKDNFSDTILPTLTSYLIKDNNLFDELAHQLQVTYNDGTSDVLNFDKKYTKGVQGLLSPLEVENTVFKPLLKSTYVNYWQGVPFDISFYSDEVRDVTITNERTGVSSVFTFQEGVSRLFLSIGFENVVPLLESVVNELSFKDDQGNTLLTLEVYKHQFCNAPYLKWFNQKGGWSYFQFERIFTENKTAITRELLNSDTENVEDTISSFQSTGKNGSLTQSYRTKSLSVREVANFIDIYTSPKVFFYNGVRNQPYELSGFKEIIVNSSNIQTNNTKLINREFSVDIELPNIYTQVYG